MKAKDQVFLFRRYQLKKLCYPSTFIEQGDVPWREQTQEWKQYEEENNANVGDYHVDYQTDYYNINEGDYQHEQCNNVRHPADLANMSKDSPEIERFPHTICTCKTYPCCHDNQPGYESNDDKKNRSHQNGYYYSPDCIGIYRIPYNF